MYCCIWYGYVKNTNTKPPKDVLYVVMLYSPRY